MIAVPAHGPTRGRQTQGSQPVVPGQQLQSSMPARRLPSQPKPVAGTENRKECSPYKDVDFSALFAHLMHLGQEETTETPSPRAVAGTATDDPPKLRYLSTPSTTTSTRDDTFFKQDSAKVLRWMKYALEDLKIDAVVVASAATLALSYLRRASFSGGLTRRHQRRTTTTTRTSNYTPTASSERRQGEQWGGRVGSETGVTAVLLSATALHLASKYHDVYNKKVDSFGIKLNPQRVYKLGLEISLSMGAVLNSSFRANPVTLQSLFCAIADESAVVRACSEWFALCLVLLLPPGDEVVTTLPQRHVPTALSDVASVVASPATSTDTASAATTAALSVDTLTSSESGSTTDSQRSSPFTSCTSSSVSTDESVEQVGQIHQRRDARSCGFSRTAALALGALALARRLARSEGCCLPLQVQETMGLGSDEILKLVAEGIAAARCVFGTEVGERGGGVNAEAGSESGKGGHELLAGEIVFERVVVDAPQGVNRTCHTSQGGISKNAEKRTLLEWVTDCRGDNAALDTSSRDDAGDLKERRAIRALAHLSTPPREVSTSICHQTEAVVDEEGADFVQGFPLIGAMDRTPSGHRFSNAPHSTPYFSLDGGASEANSNITTSEADHGDNKTDSWSYSSGSSTNSNNSSRNSSRNSRDCGNDEEYGMTVGEYLLSRRNRNTSEELVFQTDSESAFATRNSTSEEDTEERQGDSTSSSSASSTILPHLQTMRGSVPWNLHTPEDDNSTPYFEYADLPRAWFPRDDMDVVDDNDITSPPRRPSLRVGATRRAGLKSNGGGAAGAEAARKRGATERADPSWTELANSQKRKAKTMSETSSVSERHRRLLSSSASPEEGRRARWEILKDLLLVALEDDCGCSFCERRGSESSITDDESSSNTKHLSANPTNPTSASRECAPEQCFSFQGEDTAGRGVIGADGVLAKKMRTMSTLEGGESDEVVAPSAEAYRPLLQLSAAAMAVETSATTLPGEAPLPRIPGPPDVPLEQAVRRTTGMQTGLSNEDVTRGVGVAHKNSTAIEKTLSRSFSHSSSSTKKAVARSTFTSARVRVLHQKRAPSH